MFKVDVPFTVPAKILHGHYEKINGVNQKRYTDGEQIWISAKSYGGTETQINDKTVVRDTINVLTYYRPDITSIDGIELLDDGSRWEIINHPENVERKNRYLMFKIERMRGSP